VDEYGWSRWWRDECNCVVRRVEEEWDVAIVNNVLEGVVESTTVVQGGLSGRRMSTQDCDWYDEGWFQGQMLCAEGPNGVYMKM
jgi:hypothetical protein